jgi:HK97 family phage major capsid protein
MGGLFSEARAFSMPVKISIPIGTPSDKAAWHTEADEVDSEKVTVSAVSFDGYEIMKVFSISEKARKMSINAFESYIVDELRACVMDLLGYALINGTGSGQGTGLESGITWVKTAGATKNEVEVAAATDLKYSDVVSVVALLKRGYSQGAKWAMNNATLYNYFYGLVDDTGRPIFIADPKNESIGKILGFDVVVDDNIADGKAYLGNYSKYLGYNLPEGITIESSRESSFKKGVVDYRAMAIADCKPLVTEAFVRLHKKQS